MKFEEKYNELIKEEHVIEEKKLDKDFEQILDDAWAETNLEEGISNLAQRVLFLVKDSPRSVEPILRDTSPKDIVNYFAEYFKDYLDSDIRDIQSDKTIKKWK